MNLRYKLDVNFEERDELEIQVRCQLKEMNLRYKLLKRAQNYPKEYNIWLKCLKQRN